MGITKHEIFEKIKELKNKPRELIEYIKKNEDVIRDLGLTDKITISRIIGKTAMTSAPLLLLSELSANPSFLWAIPLFLGLNFTIEADRHLAEASKKWRKKLKEGIV